MRWTEFLVFAIIALIVGIIVLAILDKVPIAP